MMNLDKKDNSNEGDILDNLEEHMEHMSRTTPTTMPEWMC